MATSVVILVLFGLGLLFAEFFLPGGVLGVVGAVLLLVAVAMGYATMGAMAGNAMLLGMIVMALIMIPVWFKFFSKSPIGKRMTLKSTIAQPKVQNADLRAGMLGRATSAMRPYGTVRIGAERFEAMAESGFVEAGSDVEVVRIEADRILVRARPPLV